MPDNHDSQTPPARHANGRFGPGNPGRPPGSRNRAAQGVAKAVFDHFEANHAAVLESLRFESPGEYMRVVTRLLPKPVESIPNPSADWTEETRVLAYNEARRLLSIELDPAAALAGLEAILAGGQPDRPRP